MKGMAVLFLTCLVFFARLRQIRRERRSASTLSQKQRVLFWVCLFALAVVGWMVFLPHPPFSAAGTWLGVSHTIAANHGQGAGGIGGNRAGAVLQLSPAAPAWCNPFDPSCYASALAQYAAQQTLNAFKPVSDFLQQSSANIITQTPAKDSYSNAMIMTLNQDFVDVVDAALACLLLIGGYNVIVGHHLQMPHTSITELIPRAILVTCAVHFNLLFIGFFVDLENALCSTVISVTSFQTLTNMVQSALQLNPLSGFLLVVLTLVFLIMLVLLLFQMATRIALVALLIALAPLGLACFALPQTMRWGRLWMTTFSAAILVQFLQVTALGLTGLFISVLGATAIWHVGQDIGTIILAIGLLFLVLKIPGMLQTWALHPMMDTPGSSEGSASSSSSEGFGASSNSSFASGSSAGDLGSGGAVSGGGDALTSTGGTGAASAVGSSGATADMATVALMV